MNSLAKCPEEQIVIHARKDFPLLKQELTVGEALDSIRSGGIGERVVYFYVVDEFQKLVGVVPTRRLLTAGLNVLLRDLMVSKVVAIPDSCSVLEACEYFVLHKLLALPVIDAQRRIVGVVDVQQFTDEVFDLAERTEAETVFGVLGFYISQVSNASPWRSFRFRFPWLTATIVSGTFCAFLAGAFEATLSRSLVLTFFLALILALGESVSMQSTTVTIQSLRAMRPTWAWYRSALLRETGTAWLLGSTCGAVVTSIAWLWRQEAAPALTMGFTLIIALQFACFFGISVPWVLYNRRADPRIASGPIVLALTDLTTLLIYLASARAFL